MRSDAVKLSPDDYKYIMQYKDAKSKPLEMLRDKYPMSNTRFYQIWKGKEVCTNVLNPYLTDSESDISIPIVVEETKKRKSKFKSARISDQYSVSKDSTEKIDKISEAKKETIPPEASQKTEDPLEFYKRTQEEAKKIRAVVRADISKLFAPISKA
ncbi:1830_t:CDS:1 [Dentiscutata heterogama]|uniref:1830_t:CDS:1 n=1 Tax=Dentiscutata heterogama TaxID=1316150 RepID=A0ACA9QDS4_9GLOM|nr:1830_t:CDS:1 [Dentiscutata heterogama]